MDHDPELEELQRQFLDDIEVRTQPLKSLLNECTHAPASDLNACLRNLFGNIHSFKGTASSYQLHTITQLLHQFEDRIEEVTPVRTESIPAIRELGQIGLELVDAIEKSASENSDFSELNSFYLEHDLSTESRKMLDTKSTPHPAELRKIIYVDDDADLINFAKVFFKRHPELEVHFFSDAAAALQYLKSNTCDLMVSDVRMPDLTGTELETEFRKLPNGQNTPIIFVTGNEDLDHKSHDPMFLGTLNKKLGFPKLISEFKLRYSNCIASLAPQQPND